MSTQLDEGEGSSGSEARFTVDSIELRFLTSPLHPD
jgi:hypothetical protein